MNLGRPEGRSTTFDSTSYLAANTDLLRAGLNTTTAAQHYVTSGYTENRSTSFDFSNLDIGSYLSTSSRASPPARTATASRWSITRPSASSEAAGSCRSCRL